MNIIIIGCGRLGGTLAKELSDAGHNISVIDRDGERLSALGSGFNGLKIRGIEYDGEILTEAGISAADAVLSVTPDENINITVSLIAKKIYHVPRIIARIVNPNRQYIYEKLDIETISPTQLGADILKTKLSTNRWMHITAINQEYGVTEITVTKEIRLKVKELEEKYRCVISAVLKEEVLHFPPGEELLQPGEKIVCTVGKNDIERLIGAI